MKGFSLGLGLGLILISFYFLWKLILSAFFFVWSLFPFLISLSIGIVLLRFGMKRKSRKNDYFR